MLSLHPQRVSEEKKGFCRVENVSRKWISRTLLGQRLELFIDDFLDLRREGLFQLGQGLAETRGLVAEGGVVFVDLGGCDETFESRDVFF